MEYAKNIGKKLRENKNFPDISDGMEGSHLRLCDVIQT